VLGQLRLGVLGQRQQLELEQHGLGRHRMLEQEQQRTLVHQST
jgi:hypothetical protein